MNTALYFHIPFCHRRCIYCDFYLTTNLRLVDKFIEALLLEIILVSEKFAPVNITSIFFGGGTPSVLNLNHYQKIFDKLHVHFNIEKNAEINIECNPEDLYSNIDYLEGLKKSGFTRISLGVQSFIDTELKFLTRSHTKNQSVKTIENIKKYFDNVSIDLIYGLPGQSLDNLKYNLDVFSGLNLPHISAYSLTYEKGTLLYKKHKDKYNLNDESLFYEYIYNYLSAKNYRHYEVSNFALEGFTSQHNLSYWNFKPYLGFGPSAHSFINKIRWNNIKNMSGYINHLNDKKLPQENNELLDAIKLKEDYFLCCLRSEGVEFEIYKKLFGNDFLQEYNNIVRMLIAEGYAEKSETHFKLLSKGYQIADEVILRFIKNI